MKTPHHRPRADRDALKRAAAEAAVQLVENGMVVGLGSGTTAAFAVEALARRHRQGLRFVGIPTSERTAAQATAADIPLTSFGEHRQIDLTIDGADEVERGTLNLIKGLGGALLREKIVAAASRRLAIVVDGSKLVDRLGTHTAVPVEVVAFGLEATRESLEVLGASGAYAHVVGGRSLSSPTTATAFSIAASAASPIRRGWTSASGAIVGVVESGLFISRADPVFVADAAGVHRLDSARAHRGSPPILVIMGVSGSGKTTIAEELAARLGWPFEEGDSLHPEANIAKMHAGIPLDRRRPSAVAGARRSLDRRPARQEAAGHHHLLRAQAILSPDHHRRSAAGAAGLSARRPGPRSPSICRGATAISCLRRCCAARSTRSRNRIRARIR